MSKLDLVGNRYGRWIVLKKADVRRKNNGEIVGYWVCRCDCGAVKEVNTHHLLSGNSKSCGCSWREGTHNMSNTRLYTIWENMKSRCNYEKNTCFHNYGGRGIKVCNEWSNFIPFKDWALKHGYKDDLTLDRIDVNGNYEPDNCRWISKAAQACNRRKKNKTGYTGVYKETDCNSYRSVIQQNGKIVFYFRSNSKDECARKRNEWIINNNLDYPLNEIPGEMR